MEEQVSTKVDEEHEHVPAQAEQEENHVESNVNVEHVESGQHFEDPLADVDAVPMPERTNCF
jgi:hypothetical protein